MTDAPRVPAGATARERLIAIFTAYMPTPEPGKCVCGSAGEIHPAQLANEILAQHMREEGIRRSRHVSAAAALIASDPVTAAAVVPTLSITCPQCGRTSYHPGDVATGYCDACHDFTGDQL